MKAYLNNYVMQFMVLAGLLFSTSVWAQQLHFSNPEDAGIRLYEAIDKKDTASLQALFGPEQIEILPIHEVAESDRLKFVHDWNKSHQWVEQQGLQYLKIGPDGWEFPVPLKKQEQGWVFDVAAGQDRIRLWRLGHNELATIQAVLAYYDAQIEYVQQGRNTDGRFHYAQKLRSSPGSHDGLYWPTAAGEKPSPLGVLFDQQAPAKGYHGYYFKILTAQGNDAPGGAYNYIQDGLMNSGFALIAWPAQYGESGVTSFMISHHGQLYEKNLGPDSHDIVAQMKTFNPDKGWMIFKAPEQD